MITFRRGDDFAYIGPVRSAGVAFDLTGWGVEASMERAGAPGTLALTATVSDAPAGIIRADQAAATTATWPTGDYTFKLRLISPAGKKVSGGDERVKVIA